MMIAKMDKDDFLDNLHKVQKEYDDNCIEILKNESSILLDPENISTDYYFKNSEKFHDDIRNVNSLINVAELSKENEIIIDPELATFIKKMSIRVSIYVHDLKMYNEHKKWRKSSIKTVSEIEKTDLYEAVKNKRFRKWFRWFLNED